MCADRQDKGLFQSQASGRGNPLGPPNLKQCFWFLIPFTHNHIHGWELFLGLLVLHSSLWIWNKDCDECNISKISCRGEVNSLRVLSLLQRGKAGMITVCLAASFNISFKLNRFVWPADDLNSENEVIIAVCLSVGVCINGKAAACGHLDCII